MAAKRKAFRETTEFLTQATSSKTAGNLELLKGKALAQHTAGKTLLADACQHYLEALRYLNQVEERLINHTTQVDDDGSTNDNILEQWTTLSISVYLNLSLAGLLCKDYNSGLRSAEKVLTLDNGNTKAWYRSAKCLVGLGEQDKAVAALDRALSISPKNKDVRQEKNRLLAAINKARTKASFDKETREGLARLALQKTAQQRSNNRTNTAMDTTQTMEATDTTDTTDTTGAAKGHWEKKLGKDIQDNKEKQETQARKKRERALDVAMEEVVESIHAMVARVKPTACGLKNGGLGPCALPTTTAAMAGLQGQGKPTYYMWGQTTEAVHVLLVVPKQLKASGMVVTLKREVCEIGYRLQSSGASTSTSVVVVVLALKLTRPTRVDESTWMFEHTGLVHVELAKEKTGEWWENVTPTHPTIDIALCDGGDLLMVDVPEQQKAAYDRAMFEEMQKTPAQRDDEMKKVAMMDDWRKTRRKDNLETQSTTTKNPHKKQLYEHLKQQFPSVNIQVKGK